MKPEKNPRPSVLNLMEELNELERSPYVRLARAEEQARENLTRRLAELRELERRGRYLSAGGLTLADLGAEEEVEA
jgi:glutathione S-transferase